MNQISRSMMCVQEELSNNECKTPANVMPKMGVNDIPTQPNIPKFKFVLNLNRECKCPFDEDCTCVDGLYASVYVKHIKFPLTSSKKLYKPITFDELVTERYALDVVEKYLSEPVRKRYFDHIRNGINDKLFITSNTKIPFTFEYLSAFGIECHGDLLGMDESSRRLNNISVQFDGNLNGYLTL